MHLVTCLSFGFETHKSIIVSGGFTAKATTKIPKQKQNNTKQNKTKQKKKKHQKQKQQQQKKVILETFMRTGS